MNEPGEKVVLALGAYEPSVWRIHWTPATVIAGVFVSGYHRQAIAGLPQGVPVLNSSYENKSPCGYFYLEKNNARKSKVMMQKFFEKSAKTYSLAANGHIDFGQPTASNEIFMQSTVTTVKSYKNSAD